MADKKTFDQFTFDKLNQLFEFAQSYSSLGDAIGSQILTALDPDGAGDSDWDECLDCEGRGCGSCGGSGRVEGSFQPITQGAAMYINDRLVRHLRNVAEVMEDEELGEEIENFIECLPGR